VETTSQLTSAGQALPWFQFSAQDTKDDLRRELIANADVTAAREPQPHADIVLEGRLREFVLNVVRFC
jgi:hypothetical protein